ncbi:MAG: hypothetical protein KGM47_00190, partial [Acidobacteriota bacterium]|nr:hypothetical protein [Acidobacteriota bacterium]
MRKSEHPHRIVSRPASVWGVRAALIFGFFCLLGATSIFSPHSLAIPLPPTEAAAAVEGTVKSNSGQPILGASLAL